MTQVQKFLNDSPFARWTALVLIAAMMFFGYMFVDVLSPLQTMLDTDLGWDANTFGKFAGSEFFLNVFCFFLIFAGIILDKMGIRFTGILSASLMVIGAFIKYYAVSGMFAEGGALYDALNSFWTSFPATAKLASLGFMIFGCGVEMAGITVSKSIAKWFDGKEMALAMGLEMAIARLGVFAVFRISPTVAEKFNSVSQPVLLCATLLLIGLITFIVFAVMDVKLDKQLGHGKTDEHNPEDDFKISDLGKLFGSKTFLIVAFLCVLYYSAIFPFQKFAAGMLAINLNMDIKTASGIFSFFPIGAMILTPLLGYFLDTKGKGATMLIFGSILMTVCHTIFALVPLTEAVAYSAIVLLGVSFSLVPAALWPSVPKLVNQRYLGSAYAVIFWIQNIGLMVFPMIIGWILVETNPGKTSLEYNYTPAMLVFASLGILALILGLWLKVEDRKKGYGLELPNKRSKAEIKNEGHMEA